MPARGAAAQAEKARRKAKKRAAKDSVHEQREDSDFKLALDGRLDDFVTDFRAIMREALTRRMKRIKAENAQLRETAQQAQRTAESRRLELDGQVERARNAEKEVQSLEGRVRDVKAETQEEVTRLQEIIGEQASTIKVQARALRDAEKKLRV